MGVWDYQAIELRVGEEPEIVLQDLTPTARFHCHGAFAYQEIRWLHVGWSDANVIAYRALVAFCQRTGRRWITSYARDTRATLDATFFGWESLLGEQRLAQVFGGAGGADTGDDDGTSLLSQH